MRGEEEVGIMDEAEVYKLNALGVDDSRKKWRRRMGWREEMSQYKRVCVWSTQQNPRKGMHIWELFNTGKGQSHKNDNKLNLVQKKNKMEVHQDWTTGDTKI